MTMKKCFVIMIFVLAAALGFSQEINTEKEKDILKLLEITNTKDLCIQIFDMIIPQFSQLAPGVPQNFWDLFRQKIDVDDFINLYIPVYDKHFSHEDIRELIQFYESPIGKRFVEKTPSITQDSMAIGQEWGMRLGQKIMQELKKSGYLDT